MWQGRRESEFSIVSLTLKQWAKGNLWQYHFCFEGVEKIRKKTPSNTFLFGRVGTYYVEAKTWVSTRLPKLQSSRFALSSRCCGCESL